MDKTRGIKPLSEEHFCLAVCASEEFYITHEDHETAKHLKEMGLVVFYKASKEHSVDWYYDATREGRETLEALNAICSRSLDEVQV